MTKITIVEDLVMEDGSPGPHEVSVVDKGANKKKKFPITKGLDNMNEEMIKALLEARLEGEEAVNEAIKKAKLSDKAAAAVKNALKILKAFEGELPEGLVKSLASLEVAKKEDPKGSKKPEDFMNKIKKQLDSDSQQHLEVLKKAQDAQLEAIRKQSDAQAAELRAMKDAAALKAWQDKAETDLSHYPGKSTSEMAVMLKSLAATDQKQADELFTSMKAASDALKQSTILKAAGKVGTGQGLGGSVVAKVEKMAADIISKSADGMTKDEAIVRVLSSQPDLYTQYTAEKQEGIAALNS